VVEKELRGRGVTLRLLWLEYLARHPEGYCRRRSESA
jgi:hypothetical protein